MSTPKWTPAQQAAIDDRGGSLLVSAAAGSGKTAVLTERAVRLITDPEHPVDADKLLIVTFTNVAAAELRARISQALLRRSQNEPGNLSLRRQRMLLQRASICTIDAFCLDLLRRHFQALDIPSDFSPADPGSVESLREISLDETMEEACKNADFCAFADLYGKGRTDKPAGDAILQVYDFLRSLPNYRKKLDEFLVPWETPNSFAESAWKDILLERVCQNAFAAKELLDTALANCKEDMIWLQEDTAAGKKTQAAKEKAAMAVADKFAEPLFRLETASALMSEIIDCAQAGQWEKLYDRLTPYVLGMEEMPGLKGMKKRLTGDHKAVVRTCADEASELFEQITAMVCCSEAEAETDRQTVLPRLRALFEAVKAFDDRFAAKKLERKLLEFSDFEHYALRLLCTEDGQPTPLCGEIRQNYAAVMVDEYQDTNALQDALYRCLASPAGDDLFLVGDLKQSIYRFRQAEPGIFRKKLEQWPLLEPTAARPRPQNGTAGTDALLALDANFRSAPQVVKGINFLFEQLMSPQLGDTAYGDGQRLVCGVPGEYQGSVEAEFLPDATPETDAHWIAGRIQKMIENEEQVRSGNGTRPVKYEDCCILLSARAEFSTYAEILSQSGIPVYADAKEELLDAPHIRPLISLLKIIDNPAQDIHLAAVMLGPVFNFTEDDLVRLRARSIKDEKTGRRISLYGALLEVVNGTDEDSFAQSMRWFYQELTLLRKKARSMPIEQLMEEIFAVTGYLAALGAAEDGVRRREDVRRFASFCASAGTGGISALVRTIDAAAMAGSTGQETVPGGAHPGCVTIMTIHRSKGLQFPVVFVAGTGRRFNATDVRQSVLLHREYGAGLRLRPEQGDGSYKTAAYTAIATVSEREMRSEQMRLLYVALTRAQDKLILTAPLGGSKTTNPCAKAAAFLKAGAGGALFQQANCFADWLRAALLRHPNGEILRCQAEDRELLALPSESCMKIELLEQVYVFRGDGEKQKELPAADPQVVEQLTNAFAWRYPAAELAQVPAKVSVTSIVHKREQTDLERPAFLSKDGMTAAERGTALHSFLEHADFAVLARALKDGGLEQAVLAEADRQTALQLTPPQIAAKLDVMCICRFVQSEAFARICTAEQVLRELAFITALPARRVMQVQGELISEAAAEEKVLVQGIADLLLVYPDHLELLDYKTDRSKNEAQFLQAYREQLELYAQAVEKRFAPKKVTYKGIYSFALDKLIEV